MKSADIRSSSVIKLKNTAIDEENIIVLDRLGEGAFAVVHKAFWRFDDASKLDVAVKILRDSSPHLIDEMRVEAAHLLRMSHPNLIQLHGIVEQPTMMVLELCSGGSLLDRLRCEERPRPLVTALLEYAKQIAAGMWYLESRHCVHRDLAARNVLLTGDEQTVKIGDFGLMRSLANSEVYTMEGRKLVPYPWCPPESLRRGQFSHSSDVWAYGVTVWEMFTFGEQPWPATDCRQVLQYIERGERLEQPIAASKDVYDIMLLCWHLSPSQRPRFNVIRTMLKQICFPSARFTERVAACSSRALPWEIGDRAVVVKASGSTWRGQCRRTREIATFPRTAVFLSERKKSATSPTSQADVLARIRRQLAAQTDRPAGNDNASRLADNTGETAASSSTFDWDTYWKEEGDDFEQGDSSASDGNAFTQNVNYVDADNTDPLDGIVENLDYIRLSRQGATIRRSKVLSKDQMPSFRMKPPIAPKPKLPKSQSLCGDTSVSLRSTPSLSRSLTVKMNRQGRVFD